jgi:hypothetical protein
VLPLLSHALDQAGDTGPETASPLPTTNGPVASKAAVADSAQRVYDRLTRAASRRPAGVHPADRHHSRRCGHSRPCLAGRADRQEAQAEAQDVEAVLEAFAAERLLVLATDTVELSHEMLLTAWPLLRDTWLADTRADRIVRTRLTPPQPSGHGTP